MVGKTVSLKGLTQRGILDWMLNRDFIWDPSHVRLASVHFKIEVECIDDDEFGVSRFLGASKEEGPGERKVSFLQY